MNAHVDKAVAGTAVHRNVHVALAAAQAVMEPLIKGAVNPAFKGEGKPKGTAYADLSDVVAAVRTPFTANGLSWRSFLVRGDGYTDWRTVVTHGESDTSIECDVPLIVQKNDMQGLKSAITYAKRIGLESVSGLAPEDDDGNAAAAAAPKPKAKEQAQHIDHPRGEAPADIAIRSLKNAATLEQLAAIWTDLPKATQHIPEVQGAKDNRKAELADPIDDQIPYAGPN